MEQTSGLEPGSDPWPLHLSHFSDDENLISVDLQYRSGAGDWFTAASVVAEELVDDYVLMPFNVSPNIVIDGEYQLNLTDVYWNYDHPKHLAININGSQAWRTGGYGTERETGTVSFLAHLKRHDYITFYGTLANWTSQDTTPISHWNIVRV